MSDDSPRCLNCFEALPDPRPRFCPHCGQETNLRPPTLGEFVQQFGGAFISTEGALWRTLKLLLFAPGELTRRYLAGQRKHYVLPLRLYLTTSVIALLLMRGAALLALEPPLQVNAPIEPPKNLSIDLGFGQAGLRDGTFYCEQLPRWLCLRLERRLDVDPKRMSRMAPEIGNQVLANLGAAMFVLMPIFALLTLLAWRNRRLRYTEHLVFALHVHAFWFVAFALTLPDVPWLAGLALASIPVYTLLAMRRVFSGRLVPLLLRATFVAAAYGLGMGLAVVLAVLVALLL